VTPEVPGLICRKAGPKRLWLVLRRIIGRGPVKRDVMTHQKIQVDYFGGPEELKLVEVDGKPVPHNGMVRIKVLAAGIGYTDTMIRKGKYPEY
jgi:hypothetical protein